MLNVDFHEEARVAPQRRPEFLEFVDDPESGLLAVICVHNTARGPAMGGCRMWPYPDMLAASKDAMKLAEAMTYKNVLAELPYGGGKCVIWGDPEKDKSSKLFKGLGQAIEKLAGRYITAEDVGTTTSDMAVVAAQTSYVCGLAKSDTCLKDGNPGPYTAYGVFLGIKAACQQKFGNDDLKSIRVAVQGLGQVGSALCGHLHKAGASLTITDINPKKAKEVGKLYDANVVVPEKIADCDVDVFSPCALGGSLDHETVQKLKSSIVAGGANNQLTEPAVGDQLAERNILYAPDYVINAGGIIAVSHQYLGTKNESDVLSHIQLIQKNLLDIFEIADQTDLPTDRVAHKLAQMKLNKSHGPH